MRLAVTFLLIVLTLALVGCSYSTDFVVVNKSGAAILVSYKLKKSTNEPATLEVKPRVVLASDLSGSRRSNWEKLTADRYEVDQVNRIVKVTLNPHEALWVTSMFHHIGDEDPNDVENFPVQEISMIGPSGEMKFTGDKARF